MAATDASQYYVGKSGEDYYVHRRAIRAPDVQEYAARTFRPYISQSDTVLDFGCGTGGILRSITCGRRLGVEINEAAVADARDAGIAVFSDLAPIESESVDVAITHHALEHVAEPHRSFRNCFELSGPAAS
jgi:SAM-dependent methyltransferase